MPKGTPVHRFKRQKCTKQKRLKRTHFLCWNIYYNNKNKNQRNWPLKVIGEKEIFKYKGNNIKSQKISHMKLHGRTKNEIVNLMNEENLPLCWKFIIRFEGEIKIFLEEQEQAIITTSKYTWKIIERPSVKRKF